MSTSFATQVLISPTDLTDVALAEARFNELIYSDAMLDLVMEMGQNLEPRNVLVCDARTTKKPVVVNGRAKDA